MRGNYNAAEGVCRSFRQFYHTKKCEGTITIVGGYCLLTWFYHTKKCEGTITLAVDIMRGIWFYHTKKCEGTITGPNEQREPV